MDVIERIKHERGKDAISGVLPNASGLSAIVVAAKFDLLDSPECHEEIDASEAI